MVKSDVFRKMMKTFSKFEGLSDHLSAIKSVSDLSQLLVLVIF